jgi:DNA mismatch repair protein MutL
MALEKKSDFEALGFEFNCNEKSVDIISIPDNISPSDAEDLFVSILGDLTDGKGTVSANNEIRLEKALYSIACKAAIKGGRNYDRAIIDWLINKVLDLPDITVCPHGRPIAYKLKKTEIDRQFDRIK